MISSEALQERTALQMNLERILSPTQEMILWDLPEALPRMALSFIRAPLKVCLEALTMETIGTIIVLGSRKA